MTLYARRMSHSSRPDVSRREFLSAVGPMFALPFLPATTLFSGDEKPLRVGLIADLHHGLEPTAQSRIETNVNLANSWLT